MTQGMMEFRASRPTRMEIVRSILLEKRAAGEPGFDLRRLSVEVEAKIGKWVAEDTCRKLADILKTRGEISFFRIGKGVRKFGDLTKI